MPPGFPHSVQAYGGASSMAITRDGKLGIGAFSRKVRIPASLAELKKPLIFKSFFAYGSMI
jgi:hypothetical protein